MITQFSACADLIWPQRCAGCDREPPLHDGPLCETCQGTVSPIAAYASCRRCAAPLVPVENCGRVSLPRCADCRQLPSLLSRIRAPYEYGGALADALLALKWRGRDDLARPLGRLLAPSLRAVMADAGGFELVLPVPLHPRRLRERGYNQAALLAAEALAAARLVRRPTFLPTALRRVRLDPPAHAAGKAARFARTRDAFLVPRPAAVAGRRVLLVDDVVTTGATVLACATALREAGAVHVEALSLLRAANS